LQLWSTWLTTNSCTNTPDMVHAITYVSWLNGASYSKSYYWQPIRSGIWGIDWYQNEKAQLSLTNPRDAKACQNCSNSTCLQRCRWQYWPIFMRLAVVASKICEILRNSLKIQTYRVQGHPRSAILVSMSLVYVTSY